VIHPDGAFATARLIVKRGESSMRLFVASAALAAAFFLAPVAAGYAPALSDDFSITNQEPANPGLRDVMRQLQAWWDVHAYYPRHASNRDQGGTVKVHLVIHTDGNIWSVGVENSGSRSLDAAASAAFRGGFVRPFPAGAPEANIDLSLHYVLAHRHDQPVAADYKPVLSKSPFTITNDPVKSPILETMLQRTCTGTIVNQGIRNHPSYGWHAFAQAIFFRKPDGTPWVEFNEGGLTDISPIIEVGKLVQWTGPAVRMGAGYPGNIRYVQYTVWPDGDNKLDGNIKVDNTYVDSPESPNTGGTIDFTCATEVVPAITWSALAVTPGQSPPGDPP
jgi:TonB family protein